MLRRALELCDRHADVRTILAALAASVVLGVIPLSYAVARIGAGGQGAVPLDILNAYTPAEAYAMIGRYSADAREYYVFNAFTADVIGPALFGLTIALLGTALLRRLTAPGSWWRTAAVLGPLVGFAVDVVENAALAALVAGFPERHDDLALFAGATTTAKRVVIFATWALVLGAALVLLVRTLMRRRARS